MRIVKYKKNVSIDFEEYVDIGSCEKNYNSIPLPFDKIDNISIWITSLSNLSLGQQLIVIDFLIREYQSGGDLSIDLLKIFENNLSPFIQFINRWFFLDYPKFRYLDLQWEDPESLIEKSVLDLTNKIKDIFLIDGSVIRVDEDDELFGSFYLPLSKLETLESDLNNIRQQFIKNIFV